MRKLASLVLCTCFALVALVGCGGGGQQAAQATQTPAPVISDVSVDEFMTRFEKLIEPAGFEMMNHANLEDVSAYSIGNGVTDERVHLSIHHKGGKVTNVLLDTHIQVGNKFDFAVLILYAYKSLGAPEVDPDEFYENLGLFEDKGLFEEYAAGGWVVTVFDIETEKGVLRSGGIEPNSN